MLKDPVHMARRSEAMKVASAIPGFAEKASYGKALYWNSDLGVEQKAKSTVGGESHQKSLATIAANRPVDDVAFCKALLSVRIEPKTYGLDPLKLLVRCISFRINTFTDI